MNKTVLFKVKPGKLEAWKEWCAFLQTKEDEVLETLVWEGWNRESAYIFETSNSSYVLGVSHSMADNIRPSDKSVELNVLHENKVKECLERISTGTVGYDFEIGSEK